MRPVARRTSGRLPARSKSKSGRLAGRSGRSGRARAAREEDGDEAADAADAAEGDDALDAAKSRAKADEAEESGAGDDEPAPEKKRKKPKRRTDLLDGAELLPKPGVPIQTERVERDVRRIVGELREACGGCAYRRVCAFAPAKLQIEMHAEKRAKHRHSPVLERGLAKLRELDGPWQRGLVRMLALREKDALLAGCLLAAAWRKEPDALHDLMGYVVERCDVEALKEAAAGASERDDGKLKPGEGIKPDALQARMFRGQVLRVASFFRDEEVLTGMQELLVLDADDEGRLFQYEAVAAVALLIGKRLPGAKWIKALERDAPGPFRATFASRDPGQGGAIDVFFPYRRGKRRSYLYLRRDPGGAERLSSVDKIQIDSLLYRMFLVFGSDELKTHRIFKEMCRHLNVRAGTYNVNHILAGFERMSRDDLLLLGIYAPALARAVGHFLRSEDFHELVKLLYALRSEGGRRGDGRVPAHEKVVAQRDEWRRLIGRLGPDLVKSVFAVLFRLNASYVQRPYTTPTYLKIGEVAYLLTALSGWNPKGLEIELKQAKKPLAFVAYGLQPPGKWSKLRVGKLARAKERAQQRDADGLVRAVEAGQRYMALLHGQKTWDDLLAAAAAEDYEPPEAPPATLPAPLHASGEDFSEFEDDRESGIGPTDEAGEDEDVSDEDEPVVVMTEDEADEDGRLKTQRMAKDRLKSAIIEEARSRDVEDEEPAPKAPPKIRRDDDEAAPPRKIHGRRDPDDDAPDDRQTKLVRRADLEERTLKTKPKPQKPPRRKYEDEDDDGETKVGRVLVDDDEDEPPARPGRAPAKAPLEGRRNYGDDDD